MSSEPTTAIVGQLPPEGTALAVNASPMQLVINRLKILWCNVPLMSPEAQALLTACIAEPSIQDEDRFKGPFDCVAAIVRGPSGHNPETGEVFTSPVTTLLTATGDTFSWASPGVADCLAVLSMGRPSGVWNPPIRLECVGVKCGNGHKRMTLRAVKPTPADPKQNGGRRGA